MKDAPYPVAVGQIIDGKFRVERVIGSGGMGVVLAAAHLKLGKTVALKFLLREACENREAVNRFLREGQALARITSAHVARVMDVGTLEQGEPYIVMEYLEGSDLGALLKRRGHLPIAEATGFLLQACEAIAEAHANGIIHRDLKPSNLFLTRAADGSPLVKVLDFGISKAVVQPVPTVAGPYPGAATTAPAGQDTNTGALVGSPLYMSPEQIRNAKRVDERTDIWSLGVILYELVGGKPPFEGETVSGTLAAVCADPPKSLPTLRPNAPPALERVIMRCLEKMPERRYDSVAALARALAPFAPDESQAAVERISRVLGTPSGAEEASPASESAGRASGPTQRTWEGDTMPMSTLSSRSRRRALLVGGALLAGAAVAVVALMLGGHEHEDGAASTGSGAPRNGSAIVPQREPSAPVAPAPSPASATPVAAAVASAPPTTSLGAASGQGEPTVRATAEPPTKPPLRRERPPVVKPPPSKPPEPPRPPEKSQDGTEDRK